MGLVDYSDSDESEKGLVDYSDSDKSGEASTSPQAKRQKTSPSSDTNISLKTPTKEAPPPLPAAFHDLYASTVRLSASDDPTLHQGRKRVNPHKVGHWPSHLYIEWHLTPTEHETLTTLLSTLQTNLNLTSPSPSSPNHNALTSFLTSDLGTPQPLHISLSRPIVLSTAQKANFLSDLESHIRSSSIAPFELTPLGLQWHRTEESSRSFLVLRVGSNPQHTGHKGKEQLEDREDTNKKTPNITNDKPTESINPQLKALLHRTNGVVTTYGQPALYAWATPTEDGASSSGSKKRRENSVSTPAVDDAFHISIAWSFAAPSAELRQLTEESFNSAYHGTDTSANIQSSVSTKGTKETTARATVAAASAATAKAKAKTKTTTTTIGDAVRDMRVRVDGIKAKIGNVVTHIPLPDARNRWNDGKRRGLFGID
ncbi:U6 snRNA phosphodiesterase Usb1 [Xylaria arbuscula]|nr:U6 snRNA phosphodiesterase Usb1 [Xylaria arbuscula]